MIMSYELMATIVVPVLIVISLLTFVAKQYVRCPSNKVLVKYGKVKGGNTAETYHGGGTFIIPLIQGYTFLNLEPISIEIDLRKALSAKNIRVNVPATFTIGISTAKNVLLNAVERLLGLSEGDIKRQASEIIYGQLREVIATMTIEEINRDRDKFITKVSHNVDSELQKIGLEVINVNITDITDESGYIAAIGKKAAAEAIQQAHIDVAEQEKKGAIGQATAQKEKAVYVAEQNSQSSIGTKAADKEREVNVAKLNAEQDIGQQSADNQRRIKIAELQAEAVEGENQARAKIAKFNATLAEEEAEARQRGEVAKAQAEELVFNAQKQEEIAKLRKEELAKVEVEKQKAEVLASAAAQQARFEAQGEADAILSKAKAEAEGIKARLDAKAEGYRNLIQAAGDGKTAATLLMIEKAEDIIKEQIKGLDKIKIDKITVWDQGGKENEKGTTHNFIKDLLQVAPQLHEISANAGLKLPEFLGKMSEIDGENQSESKNIGVKMPKFNEETTETRRPLS